MPPLPKRKYAKARQGKRRSHLRVVLPATELCPQCHQPKLCHHVCPTCGRYGGEEIIEGKVSKKR